MAESYLFDTYAILEILADNKSYTKYLECGMVINDFIFSETAYKLLQEMPRELAIEALNDLAEATVRPTPAIMIEAMELRKRWKARSVSMTDCISYIMARQMGIRFLTGDKQFKGEANVEFVQ